MTIRFSQDIQEKKITHGFPNVTLHRKTNRLEHQGIKIEFIGQIELYYGNYSRAYNIDSN